MSEEQQFYADLRTCLDGFLKQAPVAATYLGDHRFDHELGSYTEESLEERRQWARRWLAVFTDADDRQWSQTAKIDRTMMIHVTRRMQRSLERLRMEYRNPNTPVEQALNGLFLIAQRTAVALEQRLANVCGRMRQLPRYLAEARAVLVPSEACPFWAESALRFARAGTRLLPLWPLAAAPFPGLRSDLEKAAHLLAAFARRVTPTLDFTPG